MTTLPTKTLQALVQDLLWSKRARREQHRGGVAVAGRPGDQLRRDQHTNSPMSDGDLGMQAQITTQIYRGSG
jgi:hypothetical protein